MSQVLDGEMIYDLQCKGLNIIQDKKGYCFTTDSVLLANFVKMKAKGYFDNVKKANRMKELRVLLSVFMKSYEKDSSILDSVLIVNGPRVLLDKLENHKKGKC